MHGVLSCHYLGSERLGKLFLVGVDRPWTRRMYIFNFQFSQLVYTLDPANVHFQFSIFNFYNSIAVLLELLLGGTNHSRGFGIGMEHRADINNLPIESP